MSFLRVAQEEFPPSITLEDSCSSVILGNPFFASRRPHAGPEFTAEAVQGTIVHSKRRKSKGIPENRILPGASCFRYPLGQPEDDAPFGVRQHDAALLLRDMSRGVFPSLTIGLKNQPTARDMSRNCKAVSCHRTPKSVPFSMGCLLG